MILPQCKISCDCACRNTLTLTIGEGSVDPEAIKARARRFGWDFGDAPGLDCLAFCHEHASAAQRVQGETES